MRRDAKLVLSLLPSLLIVFPLHAVASPSDATPDEGSGTTHMSASHDYQPPEEEDEDQHGQVLSDEEQQTFQNDQEQFEQEQTNLGPLDKNSEIRNRIQHDEAKLEKDMQAGNNPAVEDDQIVLKVDKQELREKESQEGNLSKELSEYQAPQNQVPQQKVLSSNASNTSNTSNATRPENTENSVPNQEQENLQKYQSPPEAAPRQPW
jgi:hypothetical protein